MAPNGPVAWANARGSEKMPAPTIAGMRDQIDEDSQIWEKDQRYHPNRLGPAGRHPEAARPPAFKMFALQDCPLVRPFTSVGQFSLFCAGK
jgi:hypothetical protein